MSTNIPSELQYSHILLIDIVGRRSASEEMLWRSRLVLFELLCTSETYDAAILDGQVITVPEPGRLVVLFLSDPTAPVRCALEVWEMVKELPSMAVRIGIHSGRVGISIDKQGIKSAAGEGVLEVKQLIEGGLDGDILLSQSYAETLKTMEPWSASIAHDVHSEGTRYRVSPQNLFFLNSGPDNDSGSESSERSLKDELEQALTEDGHQTGDASTNRVDLAWAQTLEAKIRAADTVVTFVSDGEAKSEFLQYQLEVAEDERRKRGRPHILPVSTSVDSSVGNARSAIRIGIDFAFWQKRKASARVISEVRATLASGITESETEELHVAGGAVPSDSKFYVHRPADEEFAEALDRHESIILVKGPRQIGKTSLIGSGIAIVNERGWRCPTTDFQQLSSRQLTYQDEFFKAIAITLGKQIGFNYDFDQEWFDALGPNLNFDGFMRSLVDSSDAPLVWFIDEADRLFHSPFASDFFGLIRSWHNARATDRRGPWRRLTIVIGYATEAHLFIKDLNQSPFNVGCALPMSMFTVDNVRSLNEKYGYPIERDEDVQALHALLGGQPFLVRRSLDLLANGKIEFSRLLDTASSDDGPFADHLKRVLMSVSQLPFVWDVLKSSFSSVSFPDSNGLHRLVAAGILVRNSQGGYNLPSELYSRYLARFVDQGWEPNA